MAETYTLLDFASTAVSHDPDAIQLLMRKIHIIADPDNPPKIKYKPKSNEFHFKALKEVSENFNSEMKFRNRTHAMINPEMYNYSPDFAPPPTIPHHDNISFKLGIFEQLVNNLNNVDQCKLKQSPQQIAFGLYTLISLTQARALTILNFSWEMLRLYGRGNFLGEQYLAKQLYKHYGKSLLKSFSTALQKTSTNYTKCLDEANLIEGETYVQFTNLFQKFLVNEVNLNEAGTCADNCEDYDVAEVYGCFSPETELCGKQRQCKGSVLSCEKAPSRQLKVCLSEDDKNRRYDWVKDYTEYNAQGGECNNLTDATSWLRFFYKCDYCSCICEEYEESDRYVSLMTEETNVKRNMVVTGIRHIKKNGVIHVQIQEGKTLPQGGIAPGTRAWKPVIEVDPKSDKFVPGEHYAEISLIQNRIDLDKINETYGYVITGARYRLLGNQLNFEIKINPIDFKTGEVDDQFFYAGNDNTPQSEFPRRPLLRNIGNEGIDSGNNEYTTFREALNIDYGQFTTPAFDAQNIAPEPPTWLSTIQVYHRTVPNIKGFIGFNVFSYDLESHYKTDL